MKNPLKGLVARLLAPSSPPVTDEELRQAMTDAGHPPADETDRDWFRLERDEHKRRK